MTIHTWKDGASGFILDAVQFADAAPFAAGDTLVVTGGRPSAQGSNHQVETLTPGTLVLDVTGARAELDLTNIRLDSTSTLAKSGPGSLAMVVSGQLVNDGTIVIGTGDAPSATGSVYIALGTVGGSTVFANDGRITVGNAASVQMEAVLDTPDISFLNTATGTLAVRDGASFRFDGNSGDTFRNDGLIVLDATSGPAVSFAAPTYGGTGTLLLAGHAGDPMSRSVATFFGAASGTFEVASGELDFLAGNPVAGTIDFLDNDGSLNLEGALTTETPASTNPLAATLNGFQAGDQIVLNGAHSPTFSYAWSQAAHTLTLYAQPGLQGAVDAVLTLGGTYTTADFHLAASGALQTADGEPLRSSLAIVVTTTSTANALPAPAAPARPAAPSVTTVAGGTVVGSTADGDLVTAGSGPETVYASGATATVLGGAGSLTFVAGGGRYVAGGGSGVDILYGGTGACALTGGAGANSVLVAGTGNATLSGGAGRATLLFGGRSATTLAGSVGGSDTLVGGAGANRFATTAGDVAFGGPDGADTFAGGGGTALLVEGGGTTEVDVGASTITAFAGTGADTYTFGRGLGGGAVIVGFKAGDHIALAGGFTPADAAQAVATATTGSFGTALTLGDGTRITLFGASITAAQVT